MSPNVVSFFHRKSGTLSYLVHDGKKALIIDPVIDLDLASGRLSSAPSDEILTQVKTLGLSVAWIVETHAHADHLTGGDYLRRQLGAPLGIGRGIRNVQGTFEPVFEMTSADTERAFDRLFEDGDELKIGDMNVRVMATPGHTDDSVTYIVGDAAFVGDTLFAPTRGTARCDFPGGSATELFATIHKLYALPETTRLFLCHDYPPRDEPPLVSATVQTQREQNAHVTSTTTEAAFVELRETRDATLSMPALIIPALQVNIRGGALPDAASNGTTYLKLPLNRL
ncbi:MAG: MBL fold metallo-hydrolase [Gammaproteobacteria bacterium]